MSLLLLLAAALVQDDGLETLGETQGWQIARVGSSCMMTREFGGDGNTILTLSIDPSLTETPLLMLVGNSDWALPDSSDSGYILQFSGSGGSWPDLRVRTFPSENEDGSVDGVISLGFTERAMTSVLDDMAGASGLRLSREQATISELRFDGAEAAIRSLGQCVARAPATLD
jgi:hypothetical protein